MSNENHTTISMVEKILSDIENIIKTDNEIQEFVIIPTEFNKNKSPVIHINYNLGLEHWCVKYVFKYAHEKLLECRQLMKENKFPKHKRIELNKFLIGALLIQPDISTFWNLKRELVLSNNITTQEELYFTKLVLSFKSKSNEAFAYRRWLLDQILHTDNRNNNWDEILANELLICGTSSNKSVNNYHAWTHRIWVLRNFLHFSISASNIINTELDFSEKWISTHVSEFSGFHYRQNLVPFLKIFKVQLKPKYNASISYFFPDMNGNDKSKILIFLFGDSENDCLKVNDLVVIYKQIQVLLYDIHLLDDLFQIYPEHESLWYHRRFLVHQLVSLLYEFHGITVKQTCLKNNNAYGQNIIDSFDDENFIEAENGEKCSKMLKYESNCIEKSPFYITLVSHERLFVEKCCQSSIKEKIFAKRYERWLKHVLGLKLISLHSF